MAINAPRRGAGVHEPVSEINVTPLVDVMLVLLIIFMITAPMLAAGMRVTCRMRGLPSRSSRRNR